MVGRIRPGAKSEREAISCSIREGLNVSPNSTNKIVVSVDLLSRDARHECDDAHKNLSLPPPAEREVLVAQEEGISARSFEGPPGRFSIPKEAQRPTKSESLLADLLGILADVLYTRMMDGTMKGRIFLFDKDSDRLIPMEEAPYLSEEILQNWLSGYPELLPGDQIDPENPRRWLLVKAEMGVPDHEGGADRWSLDHLFLDQDGIPTFVECKRSSDTRARREVVAQMLDYAANGMEYWSMERIRQVAVGKSDDEEALKERVSALIGSDDPDKFEQYWDTVQENLRDGRVRLVFVADQTTRELRRLVEFMNEKLVDIEVLAVEVKQFSGEGQRAVVPRVIGATEASRETKARRPPRASPWTEEEFIAKVNDSEHSGDVEVVQKILAWAKGRGFRIRGGRGPVSAGLDLVLQTDEESTRPFNLYESASSTKFYVYFSDIQPISGDPEKRQLLLDRLARLGFFISAKPHFPSLDISQLLEPQNWDEFSATLEWIMVEAFPEKN